MSESRNIPESLALTESERIKMALAAIEKNHIQTTEELFERIATERNPAIQEQLRDMVDAKNKSYLDYRQAMLFELAAKENGEPLTYPDTKFTGIFKEHISKTGFKLQWFNYAEDSTTQRSGIYIKIYSPKALKETFHFRHGEETTAQEKYKEWQKKFKEWDQISPPARK